MEAPRPEISPVAKLPRKALLLIPPAALFLAALGFALARGSGGTTTPAAVPNLSVRVGPDVAPAIAAQAAIVVPTAVQSLNRASCVQIKGTDYQSPGERDWYIANCSGSASTSAVSASTSTGTANAPAPPQAVTRPSAPAPASPALAPGSYVSGKAPGTVADELSLRRLGVDGPVHLSTVGGDGQMGVPDGKDDIVWYDFSAFPGLGGYPGAGGNAVFAGHVDYHPHYLAVFWYLRDAAAGDIIDYYTASGKHLQYTVDWNKNAGPEDDFSPYVSQTGSDIMTIITCDGVFNSATGHYDHRTVVRAHRTA